MRILFISNFYPPHDLGGWEQNCQEILLHLQERGHQCRVLTSRHNSAIKDVKQSEENITRALYLQSDIHYYRPLDFFLRRPSQERANRKALRQIINQFRPDIIFIWGMWNLSLQVARWAEQWMFGRVAYAVAGYWFMQPDPHESYWQQTSHRPLTRTLMAPGRQWALRILAREKKTYPLRLEHVACVSHYVRKKLDQAGVLPHGARVIYNGINPEPFLQASKRRETSQSLRLVYTGGLVAHKGVHTAVEALGLLKKQGKLDGINLDIVGAGHPDYEAHLRLRIIELDLLNHITFRGRVPRSDIPNILASHDIFLFTSIYEEPIARSVMEAMAAGLAVIGTPVGGQTEMLIHNENALVYPAENSQQLAEAILTLKQDPALRLNLVKKGRDMVLERFTLERMVDEIEIWLNKITK